MLKNIENEFSYAWKENHEIDITIGYADSNIFILYYIWNN